MKKFIFGLLVGLIITMSFSTYAAVKLDIIPNPYPILLNRTKANVGAYNINGSTYIKLTDLKALGIDAQYNGEKKQIEINSIGGSTTEAEPAITESQSDSSTDFTVPEIDQTSVYNPTILSPDDNFEITTYKDMKAIKYKDNFYINIYDLSKYKNISLQPNGDRKNTIKLYQNKQLILESLDASPTYYISYQGFFYINTEFLGNYLEE